MPIESNLDYPMPDLSQFPIQVMPDTNGVVDLGWYEGALSDSRPFRARLWVEGGTSCLSLFFSSDDLPALDSQGMRHFLEKEGLVSFGASSAESCDASAMTDGAGNRIWNAAVVIGGCDCDEFLQLLTAVGSIKLHAPCEGGEGLSVLFPIYPYPEAASSGSKAAG